MENTPPRIERFAPKIGLGCKIPASANLSILGAEVEFVHAVTSAQRVGFFNIG